VFLAFFKINNFLLFDASFRSTSSSSTNQFNTLQPFGEAS